MTVERPISMTDDELPALLNEIVRQERQLGRPIAMPERHLAAIELAATRIEQLCKALEPFAKAADVKLCGEWGDEEHFGQTDVGFYLTFGDLRTARAALIQSGER